MEHPLRHGLVWPWSAHDMYLIAAPFDNIQGRSRDFHIACFSDACKVSLRAAESDVPPHRCRMTVRQFGWASHEQGGPFVIYDVSEGLVYVDRQ